MIYYAVKIHQLSPAQHITKTQKEIIRCGPSQHHNAKLQRSSRADDARVVKQVVFSVQVQCYGEQSHCHLSCQDVATAFSLFTALCTSVSFPTEN